MRGKLLLAAISAAALALPLQTARAFDPVSGSGCGGQNYTFCASWSLLLDGSTWKLNVTNVAETPTDLNDVIQHVGLFQAVDPGTITIALLTGAGQTTSGWSLKNTGTFNGFTLFELVFEAASSGVPDGIASGETAQFWFTVDGTGAGNFSPTQIGLHSTAVAECSAKSVFNLSGTGQSGTPYNPDPGSENCGGTTVPEPATLALFATGIVGILAARRRHRVMKD